MDQVGSHGGKDHQNGPVEVGSHRQVHELWEEIDNHHDGRHRSRHGAVGFYRGNHHDEGYIHGMGRVDHNPRQGRVDVGQGIGIELGHGEYQVESGEL